MLKKLLPLAVALAAMLAPTAPAAAWERVCMKLPLGKAAFSATLNVLHGFKTEWGIPNSYDVPGKSHRGGVPRELRAPDYHNPADGLITSGVIAANRSACADISAFPPGTPFVVYVDPTWAGNARVCATHPSNPDPWYLQTNRPYSTLWYEAWGAVWSPKCEFKYESN